MNLLVFTKNWLGDVIFETPAFRTIKENYPGSRLTAVAPARCLEILLANPHVDEVLVYDGRKKDRNPAAWWKLIRAIRERKIDKAYLFHRSWMCALIATLGGARERIGYDTNARAPLLTCAVPDNTDPIHDVDYFLGLMKASGLAMNGGEAVSAAVVEDGVANGYARYEFYFSKQDLEQARSLFQKHGLELGKAVAINPGANWAPKRWPASHFARLAEQLTERYGVQIVITGSADDQPIAEQILRLWKGPGTMVSLCGKTTVCQLGAVFSLCRLVVSNDTGPLHIAGGVGTNVVGIFGPTDSIATGPRGRGKSVLIHYVPKGQRVPWIGEHFPGNWLERLSPDEVFDRIVQEKLLECQ